MSNEFYEMNKAFLNGNTDIVHSYLNSERIHIIEILKNKSNHFMISACLSGNYDLVKSLLNHNLFQITNEEIINAYYYTCSTIPYSKNNHIEIAKLLYEQYSNIINKNNPLQYVSKNFIKNSPNEKKMEEFINWTKCENNK